MNIDILDGMEHILFKRDVCWLLQYCPDGSEISNLCNPFFLGLVDDDEPILVKRVHFETNGNGEDRGVQFLSIRYTQRLAEAGINSSVGSRGDSYDNALAESFNGLYKTELIHYEGPWRGPDDVEWATLTYVHWFNHTRLHGEIGMQPPAEHEHAYSSQTIPAETAGTQPKKSL